MVLLLALWNGGERQLVTPTPVLLSPSTSNLISSEFQSFILISAADNAPGAAQSDAIWLPSCKKSGFHEDLCQI